ncbi:hypothetical protein CSPAE12_09338 [Colletotrichum incanum]|nr:hypothetical protein CSPAE12_09338 [Colletotrichum incanum]
MLKHDTNRRSQNFMPTFKAIAHCRAPPMARM